MRRSAFVAFAAAGFATAALAESPLATRAQQTPALRTITIGTTSRTANDWPTYVADRYGFFAANGLKPDVIVVGVTSGIAQQLTGGSLDLGEITTTQMVEAVQGGAPLVSIMNAAVGVPYFIVGRKGLTSVAQLKGKLVSIGGPADITRVFMDTVLEKAGLKPDDWTYTFAGSTSDRFAAMMAGAIDGTILFPPFSFRAAGQGFPVLDEVSKYFPNFPFTTWAVRSAWLRDREHVDLAQRFIRAQLQAARWLYDRANRDKAIALLAEVTNSSPEDAGRSYDVFVGRVRFYSQVGTFAPESFNLVLQAMVKTNLIAPPLPPPTKFYDNRYAEQVNAQLGRPAS